MPAGITAMPAMSFVFVFLTREGLTFIGTTICTANFSGVVLTLFFAEPSAAPALAYIHRVFAGRLISPSKHSKTFSKHRLDINYYTQTDLYSYLYNNKNTIIPKATATFAVGVGFEPTRLFRVTAFQAVPLNHSGTPPNH